MTQLDYKEVARKAADELQRRGWKKGGLVPEDLRFASDDDPRLADCKVCAVGALNAAVYGSPLGRPTGFDKGYTLLDDYPELLPIVYPFSDALGGEFPDLTSIFRYNDRSASSGEDVIDKFCSVTDEPCPTPESEA